MQVHSIAYPSITHTGGNFGFSLLFRLSYYIANYSTKLSLCLLLPEQRLVPDLMQPLGLESQKLSTSACVEQSGRTCHGSPGALQPFVCCKLLAAHGSFFTRKAVSSITWHSRHCSSLIDPWALLMPDTVLCT